MKSLLRLALGILGAGVLAAGAEPLRVGIVGLAHGHAAGFLSGSALVPAGGAVHRPDVEIAGIVEPDDQVYRAYAERYHWADSMRYRSIEDLAARAHPKAVLVFTSTAGHTDVVKKCASLGIHVMMEKPMAVSYKQALEMAEAARRGHIHVLVDYETTWYPSNTAAHRLVEGGQLGPLRKAVFRDGHEGPKKIQVQPEFFRWLTDPAENGAGALYDFGCYGADLMTWFKHGAVPVSVTAMTKQLQPEVYPKVDDDAEVILEYKDSTAVLQASWNWPFGVKDMDVYGETGYAKAVGGSELAIRGPRDKSEVKNNPEPLRAPYDDPLHHLAAVIRGEVEEGDNLSSLKTNVTVSQILDAARKSAKTGSKVTLPLQ